MKIAKIITTSISMPTRTRPLMRSYLDLLLVLELDAGARRPHALDGLGYSLDEEQEHGERDHHLVGPQDRPPRRLLGGLADLEGIPAFPPAHPQEHDERW